MKYPTDLIQVIGMRLETTPSYYYEDNFNGSTGDYDIRLDEILGNGDFTDYPLVIFYVLVFVFSLCANILVLVIIYLFEKLTTVTNLLLLNLVMSSLLFIITVPFMVVYMVAHWPFGDVMCKMVYSLYYLSSYSSVLFLTLLTFDRHLAVVYSLTAHRIRSRFYALVSCAVVWMLSALATIKPMILVKSFYHEVFRQTYCQEDPKDSSSLLWHVGFCTQLLFFLFPLLIIVYCYTRIAYTVLSSQLITKFKTVRLIFVIVVFFFICWTPFTIATLMFESASTIDERRKWREVREVTEKFHHLYFCISPVFYTFVGRKFQNYFRMLLVRRFPRLERHISVSQISPTNMTSKTTPDEL